MDGRALPHTTVIQHPQKREGQLLPAWSPPPRVGQQRLLLEPGSVAGRRGPSWQLTAAVHVRGASPWLWNQNRIQTSEHPGSSIFPKLQHLLLYHSCSRMRKIHSQEHSSWCGPCKLLLVIPNCSLAVLTFSLRLCLHLPTPFTNHWTDSIF